MKSDVDLGKETSAGDPGMRRSLPSEISGEPMLMTKQLVPLVEVLLLLFCDLESVEGFTGSKG